MNMDDAPAPELEQPQARGHNHLGLWIVLLGTVILGTVTTKALLEHVLDHR
jgi:hypothetical protein